MNRREFTGKIAAAAAAMTSMANSSLPSDEMYGTRGVRPAIPRRILGKTGVEVPVLVIGGVAGMAMKPSPDFNPSELAAAALDAGITYFDTASAYGDGQSEINYGVVLAKRRNEVFLASKTIDRTYDGTMRSLEESLKRLQTDHLDLYQVHGLTDKEDITGWNKEGGVMKAMYRIKEEKIARFIGITGHETAEAMNRAIDMYEFDTILTTFNPVQRRKPFRESVLPNAISKNMSIIAMKVMGGGGGALASGNPAKNINGNWNWDEAPAQADSTSLVRYVLGLPVSCAVIGMKSIDELRKNLAAITDMKPFTRKEQAELEQLMT
jgi:aryl-alcohol dehydrogenase-like predicted oxidoreductase